MAARLHQTTPLAPDEPAEPCDDAADDAYLSDFFMATIDDQWTDVVTLRAIHLHV